MSTGNEPAKTSGRSNERRLLRQFAGQWHVECLYYTDPVMPPSESDGKLTVDLVGSNWCVSRFTTALMGMPFTEVAFVGLEPGTSNWLSFRVTSLSPHHYMLRGGYNDEQKALLMAGSGPDPNTGRTAEFRTVEEFLDADRRKFEMFTQMPDGSGEYRLLTYHLTRLPEPANP